MDSEGRQYYTILDKGLEHPRILVFCVGFWNHDCSTILQMKKLRFKEEGGLKWRKPGLNQSLNCSLPPPWKTYFLHLSMLCSTKGLNNKDEKLLQPASLTTVSSSPRSMSHSAWRQKLCTQVLFDSVPCPRSGQCLSSDPWR